ncbi:hypothetical protein [Massilia oculi]|uniref:hypothetical protein n=1 Tax=Massilia oculi TaxID=945844 RepID=UPI001AAFB255|nr:hypothetical protein [Massilia oculi]
MTIAIAEKTDAELAADARMIVAALSRIRVEACKRKIDIDLLQYSDGTLQVEIERVTREKL